MKLIDLLVQELPKRGGWPDGSISHLHEFIKKEKLTFIVNRDYSFFEDWDGNQVTREQYEAALAASQKAEWNGEGMPPVGCEFEHSFHADGFSSWHWRKCTALGRHGVLCVDKDDVELYLNDTNNKFRPIRSEADKKRDEVTNAIAAALFKDGDFDTKESLRLASFVYGDIAAGKIPGVRIE